MKVGFLITGLGTGGAERHLLKILPKLDFELFVISLTNLNEVGKELEKRGIKVYYLGMSKFNPISAIIKFKKIIKEEKPDILDTYLIHANLFGRFFGRWYGVKKIVNSVRNDYSDLRVLNYLDKISKGRVDLFVPNSSVLVDYLHNKNGVPLSKIKALENGIDLKEIRSELDKKYSIKKELGLDKKDVVLVCVARLEKQKGIYTLINAIAKLDKKHKLVLVGEGSERKVLERLVKGLNLKNRVFFLGTRTDVLNIVNTSDVFVLPSIKEGMSNALLEAMALAKPCVVSNISANQELITDGVNGLTFRVGDSQELAENIMRSLLMKGMGKRALKEIKEKYSIAKTAKKYKDIVQNV